MESARHKSKLINSQKPSDWIKMCGDTVALQFLRVPHEMSDLESDSD